MKIEREQQKANKPGAVGRGQSSQVPTHEGSMLNQPTKAGVKTGRTPKLS